MSLYTVEKSPSGGEQFVWHPHALLLIGIGDSKDVIGCLHANLMSFGSSGSRVPYLEKRIELLKTLPTNEDPRLVEIADALVRYVDDALKQARKQDAHHAAGIY
jgi:hypothetical protein